MKLKRTLAAIIAATTMAVGLFGTSVISSATSGEHWDVLERDSNGNITKLSGFTGKSILGTPISMSAYQITLNMTHTTAATAADQVLVSVALNDSSTTRYMGSSVYVKDAATYSIIFSTSQYSSGDIAPHGACTASKTVSNSSLGSGTYWLCYSGSLHGGTSYHAAVQSEIDFEEYYSID